MDLKNIRYKKIETSFSELCEILKPKLRNVDDAMEYVRVGECGLALELICDWCVDAEPVVLLTINEILRIKEIGKQVNKEEVWIDLLPLLIDTEIKFISKNDVLQAKNYIKNEIDKNPIRKKWLSKIKKVIDRIENTVKI